MLQFRFRFRVGITLRRLNFRTGLIFELIFETFNFIRQAHFYVKRHFTCDSVNSIEADCPVARRNVYETFPL